jgi:hypothetical protein
MEKINPKGYSEVSYKEMQNFLSSYFEKSEKSLVDAASALNVKSPITIKNALSTDMQLVSDTLLSAFMNYLSFPGAIVYQNGDKAFFINSSILKSK